MSQKRGKRREIFTAGKARRKIPPGARLEGTGKLRLEPQAVVEGCASAQATRTKIIIDKDFRRIIIFYDLTSRANKKQSAQGKKQPIQRADAGNTSDDVIHFHDEKASK